MRPVCLALLACLLAVPAFAQTTGTPGIAWDFANTPVAVATAYQQAVVVDGTPVAGPVACVAAVPASTTTCSVPLATKPSTGSHTVVLTVIASGNQTNATATIDTSKGANPSTIRFTQTFTITRRNRCG